MSEETIRKVLTNSGLTEKEAEVYIFLAKHDTLKGTEIAKLIRKDKAQVFHILKRLQAKGFVESTIEFPAHFTAIPFENVLDSIICTRQEEVAFIEKSRRELLDYLRRKRKVELEPTLEKFAVIKGNKSIYAKISKMILETKHQLLAATSVLGLMRADQFGIFDVAFNNPLRSRIQYRFLTELSEQNLSTLNAVLARTPKTDFNLKTRNPDLGLNLFPRMVAKDREEILFFITPRTGRTERDDVCLWTNCKSLINAFITYFEELWSNSEDIDNKLAELVTGKLPQFVRTTKHGIQETISLSQNEYALTRTDSPYNRTVLGLEEKHGTKTEKDILKEIINAKRYPPDWPRTTVRFYGRVAHAVIHPPKEFKLPHMIIWVEQYDKQSSFGAEDLLSVFLWLDTPNGYAYVPVVAVTDNPKTLQFHKEELSGTPAGQNVKVVEKDDIQLQLHGNVFFAGWTVPIPLFPLSLVLPPCCMILEGFEKLTSGSLTAKLPSGVEVHAEFNGFQASVTFLHPLSKYSGPGTDGIIGRDAIVTKYPPE